MKSIIYSVIGGGVAIYVAVLMISLVQSSLAAQTTTSWDANSVAITWALPAFLALAALIGIVFLALRAVGSGTKGK